METTRDAPPAFTEPFLAEFEMESDATRRLLDSVPPERYDWRPHRRGRSMGELCNHIATALHGIPEILDAERFDLSQRPPPEEAPESREALLAFLDEGSARVREWIEGLGDRMHGDWTVVRGDDVVMSMPRWMGVRWLLFNHVYHHRGQLSAYLRAAGEFVPSVYGPSADEDPFAAA